MPDKIISNSRGTALLITLAVITLVIAVTLEINRQVRSSVTRSAAGTDRIKLIRIASSGINAAQAILVKDRNKSDADSLLEDWADDRKVAKVLDDMPFENGSVTVNISDELSRIQVNALVKYPETRSFNERQRIIWEQLIRYAKIQSDQFEDIDPDVIINSAKDWLDTGDDDAITGLSGAESDYYMSLDSPYACKNGPFAHIDELALLKGFPMEFLHGSDRIPGIAAYLTVRGVFDPGDGKFDYPGRINLNTAEPAVIAAILPWENKDQALAIVDFRQLLIETDNTAAFQTPLWYQQAPGCGNLKIDPALLTVSSDLFRIESTAALGEARLTVIALVRRENQKKTGRWVCKTLQWEIK